MFEVKCFTNPEVDLPEFYAAIGQYCYYRAVLSTRSHPLPLYLAIPNQAYMRLIDDPGIENTLQQVEVSVMLIDVVQEEVVKWLP